LREFGWDSVVVTGAGGGGGRWTPQDGVLSRRIPDSTDVRRVDGPEPAPSGGLRGRGERWLRVESPWRRWWIDGQINTGLGVSDVDVIYAWMSPFESAHAASALAKKLRRPWVADLGDPWALDEMMVYPTRVHRAFERREMRRQLATAEAIVMSTDEATDRLVRTFPELRGKLVVTIPNGYVSDDFSTPVPPRLDETFRIVHTGYLHTELGLRQRRARFRRLLGGALPNVDFLTRSHVYLLQAVERLLDDEPDLRGVLEVHLAGVVSDVDRETAERSRAARLLGYLPHDRTLELVRTADLLFLPMHSLPPGRRASIVPGKTYEYLASGQPVLAAVPDGDARDILDAAGNCLLCRPDDVAGIQRAISDAVRRQRSQSEQTRPRPDVVERFEYRRLTRQLADVFDHVAPARDEQNPEPPNAGLTTESLRTGN
jgi:glycosyltransferase involved in cell wall biosynthesis